MHTQRRYATCFGMFKIKDAYPKKVATCPQGMSKKERKREEKKIAPIQIKRKKKKQEWDDSYKGVHQPSTKNIFPHTCTSWSRFMTYLSFGSGFWFNKIREASLFLYPPYIQLYQKEALGVGWKSKANFQSLGEVEHHWAIWEYHLRRSSTYVFICKNYKTPSMLHSWIVMPGCLSRSTSQPLKATW